MKCMESIPMKAAIFTTHMLHKQYPKSLELRGLPMKMDRFDTPRVTKVKKEKIDIGWRVSYDGCIKDLRKSNWAKSALYQYKYLNGYLH